MNKYDYPGKIVGDYTVVEFSHINKFGLRAWICKCKCGETLILDTQALRGKCKCKCANGSENLKGNTYGRLTALSYSYTKSKPGRVFWDCLCECGKTVTVRTDGLKSGNTLSCGCLQKDITKALKLTHGKSGSRVYTIWEGLINRTRNKANARYHRYGGRGIKVCDEWLKFENFYKDMGEPPTEEHQIDRIDNDGDYEPGNCRWVLPIQNAYNKGARTTTTSKYKGVYYDKSRNKWVCRVNKDHKKVFFKRYDTEIEAAKAYNEQAKTYYGEYAYLNKI
jgi:hypothetical protein